jgi:hypothetical protein
MNIEALFAIRRTRPSISESVQILPTMAQPFDEYSAGDPKRYPMEWPTDDAPINHSHSWFSCKQAHAGHFCSVVMPRGGDCSRNEMLDQYDWTELTTSPQPRGVWNDYVYRGLIANKTYPAAPTSPSIGPNLCLTDLGRALLQDSSSAGQLVEYTGTTNSRANLSQVSPGDSPRTYIQFDNGAEPATMAMYAHHYNIIRSPACAECKAAGRYSTCFCA